MTLFTTAITDLMEMIKALHSLVLKVTPESSGQSPIVFPQSQPDKTVPTKRLPSRIRVVHQSPSKISSPPSVIQRVLDKASPTTGDTGSKRSPSPLNSHDSITRTLTYFRGLGRREVWQMRHLFKTLGIPSPAVQFIQFVGAHITELIILDRFKDEVVNKLARVKIKLDPTFDPLNHKSFTVPNVQVNGWIKNGLGVIYRYNR